MARINELRKARRGRRTALVAAAALLALAALQVGTSSALVPADLVDAYADAGHLQQRVWFAPGDTVYMRGGLAGSTRSQIFVVTDPTGGAPIYTGGCQVRNLSATDAFDSFTVPSNAVLGAATPWTERFIEFANTNCTNVVRDRSSSFRVARVFAFDNATDRNNCGGATPGAFWPASCANAKFTFTAGSQVYLRVLGLEPGTPDVSTTWAKPSGPVCMNTSGTDRPDTNGTDGRLDIGYPPLAPEVPDNAANCGTPVEVGNWILTLAGDTGGVKNITFAAFALAAKPTPTVSTTIHDPAHQAVTTVAINSTVHDFVSVSGGTGNPVPTGTVLMSFWDNGGCSGMANVTYSPSTGLDAMGTVDVTSTSFNLLVAQGFAFRAHYNGDAAYSAADGPCEPLQVVDANIQIAPLTATNPVGVNHVLTITVNAVNGMLDAGAHTATATIDSGPGSFVGSPSCTYTGGAATASCTVTITSSSAGTTKVSASATIPVSGVSMTRSTDGTDANSGPAAKYWGDDSVATVVRDAANNDVTNTTLPGGTVVHDEATVTRTAGTPAPVPDPTGTVDFTLYDNGTCDGNVVATDPNKPLNGSGVATSATFTIPATVGPYSYLAHYNGDANYPGYDGPCEAINFDGVAPVTTITLDPASPDVGDWYVFAVKPTVSATDVGTGVAETRCVLDPATPPASFDDLPSTPCPYLAPSQYVLTEGIHTLYAASRDTAGNKETPVKSVQFKIDKTAPVATVSALSMFQGSSTFTVSWSGTDNLSGVKNYDVRYRQAASNGSFGSFTTWFSHTTSTSASFTAPAGSTTCFSVKATDNAGWTSSAWSAEQCTTVPLDDPALTRIGLWSTVTGTGYYGPGVSRTTSSGPSLSVAMRGQTIGVLVTKQPGGGTIQLSWNGTTKLTASISAGSVQKQQLLTFTLPSVQSGTLAIASSGFGTVDIDGAGAYKTS